MSKLWGKNEYWGLSSDYDPDFLLTDEQKELRNKLIELCRTKIRPNAVSLLFALFLDYILKIRFNLYYILHEKYLSFWLCYSET